MADPRTDQGLAGAVHRLIGCDWGHTIAHPLDSQPCYAQAAQRTVLHGVPGTGDLMVKLCDRHATTVNQHTDPSRNGPRT